jgi:hypothetical protein
MQNNLSSNFFNAKINWANIHQALSNIDWKQLIDQVNSVDEANNIFDYVLLHVCVQHVSKEKNTQKSKYYS